jgi:hypothetical protein
MRAALLAALILIILAFMFSLKIERKARTYPDIFCHDPAQGEEEHFCEYKLRQA